MSPDRQSQTSGLKVKDNGTEGSYHELTNTDRPQLM